MLQLLVRAYLSLYMSRSREAEALTTGLEHQEMQEVCFCVQAAKVSTLWLAAW